MSTSLNVYFDDPVVVASQEGQPAHLGTLFFDSIRGTEVSSFEYASSWLKRGKEIFFDPDLMFFAGRQYVPKGKQAFGFVADVCPDRWGRSLLARHEGAKAEQENRKPRTLLESDYLLGVNDKLRMGALRFTTLQEKNTFLAESTADSIPPWIMLRELEEAARILDSDASFSDESQQELALLLAPGSSLGGARPKASIQDPEGNLWIAKFPSGKDEFDSGLAEALTYKLAQACGLNVAEYSYKQFSSAGHTFLIKRFDRKGDQRIHFASAMTLLGKTDGDNAFSGVSYLDIVELIRNEGSRPTEDLQELFKRIAFSITVSNTDDHLRNHGFLLDAQGWQLSPLFDVNPNPQGQALSLNIDEHSNRLSFDLLAKQAEYFELDPPMAKSLIKEVREITGAWEQEAKRMGMAQKSIKLLRPAFG